MEDKSDDFWVCDKSSARHLSDEYIIGDVIGRGASSVVYKCLRKGRSEWACKVFKKSQLQKPSVQSEIRILLTLRHPNIPDNLYSDATDHHVPGEENEHDKFPPELSLFTPHLACLRVQLKDVFETDDEIQLILELVQGGELFERIVERGQYTEQDASAAVRHILKALEYLHSHGIAHRDIKPENLLYESENDDSALKLADFGLSKLVTSKDFSMTTVCGTVGYCAPEILLHKPYDCSIDIWSLGVVAYIMLCGYEPFFDEAGEVAVCRKVVQGDYNFQSMWWDHVSDSAKDFICSVLSVDPSDRPTARQALSHPWVRGDTSPSIHMRKTVLRLREFNAKRKFKAATKAVMATHRALHLLSPDKDCKRTIASLNQAPSDGKGEFSRKFTQVVSDGKAENDSFHSSPLDDTHVPKTSLLVGSRK